MPKLILKNGGFDGVYAYESCYGFIRFDEKNKIIVLTNFGENTEIRLDVARYGVFSMHSDAEKCVSKDGIFLLKIPENTTKIFFAD